MRVLVDMDEVIADSLGLWMSVLKRRYPGKVPQNLGPKNVKPFSVPWQEWGLTWREFRFPLIEPGFFRRLLPFPGARDFIKTLSQKHEVIFVTTPPRGSATAAYEKELWIQEHFPETLNDNIVFTRRKDLVSGDILIDDKESNLRDFNGIRILFDLRKTYENNHRHLIDTLGVCDYWVTNYRKALEVIHEQENRLQEPTK